MPHTISAIIPGADALALIPTAAPRLTELDLTGCAALTDGLAIHLATSLPALTTLALAHNPQLSARALQRLGSANSGLKFADFSFCNDRAAAARAAAARQPRGGGKRTSANSAHLPPTAGPSDAVVHAAALAASTAESAEFAEIAEIAEPPRGDAKPAGWDGTRLSSIALRGWDSLSEFRLKDADNLREIHLGGCSRLQLVRVRAHSDLHTTCVRFGARDTYLTRVELTEPVALAPGARAPPPLVECAQLRRTDRARRDLVRRDRGDAPLAMPQPAGDFLGSRK